MENNFIGDFMEKNLMEFTGLWNGESCRNWFDSEVDDNAGF